MAIRVTVVGMSRSHSGKRKVSVGSRVVLSPEKNNAIDPDAISVYTEDESEQVGYVGNAIHTVSPGTSSASDVKGLFTGKIWGKIVADANVQYKNGHVSKAFVVEFQSIQETKGENKMNEVKEMVFKVIGSKSQYPVRFEQLIPDFMDGKEPYVKLVIKADEIIAEYNGQPCGYVSKDKGNGLTEYDDILSSIGDSKVAKITRVVGTKVFGAFSVDEKEMAKQKTIMTMTGVIQSIVDQDINTQEEINEKMDYLKKCGVTEKQMLGMFKTYKKYDDEIAKLIPKKPKTLYQDSTGIIKRSVAYVNLTRNLMLEGDRGVGKNVMIETLAWLFYRPLFEFSLNSQHDNSSLLGGKTIEVDENGNNVMGFDPEVIVQAGEVGGILNLDEFNTSIGHVMSVLNSYLDDRRRVSVPGYKVVQADPNFVVIATMNKDYQSTFELNEATSDRFVPIVFPKSKSIVQTLVAKNPDVDFSVIQKCDLLYKGILKCVEDGEISDRAVTIRGFIDASMATLMDISLKEALLDNVANRCSELDDRRAVANMIEDILG